MSGPGPVPSRQDAPHPHEAKLDPTGSFILVPDLGADLIRIHSVNKDTGILTNCANHTAKPGSGPRHVSFWVPPANSSAGKRDGSARRRRDGGAGTQGTMMYLGSELANTITAFEVEYTGSCIELAETQDLAPYPAGKSARAGAKVAEVQVYGQTLTTSNRADNSFGANNDSLALFGIDSTGKISFQDLYPTFASYPRTMVINKAGDMVAVGNQNSAEVTVVQRDPGSGKFGSLLGSVVVGSQGTDGNGGLSSVIWEE
ncbi:MAG: hypothetical protein MMC23_006083 [Stictis urceolatum]|nr:hypothetical protein [Stictis urceolata]